MNRYPLGIQTFEEIRKNNQYYVDKTDLIYNIAKGSQSNFLNRPRRFGKSLLVTTMQAYFEGKKELFKGLAIEKLEKEWVKYPVIHLDLSRGKYYEIQMVHSTLNAVLGFYEAKLGITVAEGRTYGTRLDEIIQTTAAQTGQKVVVLIDEYDAPMLDSNAKPELQEQIRSIMRDFFSPLKANEGLLRFVFLTGITKFSQLSIFSELNNIKNYSLDDRYATICGFTEQELLDNFHEGITDLAAANGMTFDEAVEKLKEQYDGYHFTAHCPGLYNPYSILNALFDSRFDNYWFATGTPTFLLELLQKNNILIPQLEGIMATPQRFDAPTEKITDPVPVLYQSGYITIKKSQNGMYLLGFPNEEVRQGFSESMLNYIAPYYAGPRDNFAWEFGQAMRADNIDAAMEALKVYLAGFPYDIHHNSEAFFQAILYTIFNMLNFTIRAEARTARGRVDLLVSTKTTIFVMELKIDQSAEKALEQIDAKDYILPYKHDGRRIFKVGINFSTEKRTVDEWKYEEA
ncbi:ATP-binding protein [Hallella absiana]|uniref:ATP-binding protein n=1 Tax=Hallella absiana TaxID=2925336 RepID=UPI0021CA14AC|nr:ATP-binding protein [Hallella absiana]